MRSRHRKVAAQHSPPQMTTYRTYHRRLCIRLSNQKYIQPRPQRRYPGSALERSEPDCVAKYIQVRNQAVKLRHRSLYRCVQWVLQRATKGYEGCQAEVAAMTGHIPVSPVKRKYAMQPKCGFAIERSCTWREVSLAEVLSVAGQQQRESHTDCCEA